MYIYIERERERERDVVKCVQSEIRTPRTISPRWGGGGAGGRPAGGTCWAAAPGTKVLFVFVVCVMFVVCYVLVHYTYHYHY